MNEVKAKKHHKQLRAHLIDAIDEAVKLTNAMGADANTITLMGTITTEAYEILGKVRDEMIREHGEM